LKFVHIMLDRGLYASQPILTVTGRGSLVDQKAHCNGGNANCVKRVPIHADQG